MDLNPEIRIETARLVLRPTRADDAVPIAALIDDFEIARMTTHIPHPYALQDAEAFCAAQLRSDPRSTCALQVETLQGQLIGGVGARRTAEAFPEIGYWLARSFWGRGLASEAVVAFCEFARGLHRARALVAGHFVDNPASGRVLINCGFLYTGVEERRFSLSRGAAATTRMMIRLA